ncbi:MAG: hypothetical protein WAK55_07115 [Xanthobacteraceae bacterium]
MTAESKTGTVQWLEPAHGWGFISLGNPDGGAVYFTQADVVGCNCLVGDKARFLHHEHGRSRATSVMVIPK